MPPSASPLRPSRRVERRQAKLLANGGLVLDIEPLLPPSLDGILLLEVEVDHLVLHRDLDASSLIELAGPLHVEEVLPQAPVRKDPQEALAERDEACDLQDTVGGEIVQL